MACECRPWWHTETVSTWPDTDHYGVTSGFYDVHGEWHETPDEVGDALRAAIGEPVPGPPMWFVHQGDEQWFWSPCRIVLEDGTDLGAHYGLPVDLPIGYHDLVPVDGGPATRLVVAPEACPAPPAGWGVSAQLYSMLSSTSQGIGDFADLITLARWVESHGGRHLLLSPLHAASPAGHQQDSPYYPSSKRWRNPLHLRVPGVDSSRPEVVDRDAVWATKRTALRALFEQTADGPDASWRTWASAAGAPLREWAQWCAEQEGALEDDAADFHAWLQWCIERQLDAVHDAAPTISLIGDLAIGFDPSGADGSAFSAFLAHGCRIGAPPDQFNTAGQDWGLPPFIPWKLRAACYEPFIQTVRGALRNMQGLRMDHVMGLFRQYWVPPGATAAHGAYVRFPADELLAIVSIEAARAGAFVIGEDLGTVENGVREALAAHGILGTTVMWFTDDAPEAYPANSLATITTHDLPTILGVHSGDDSEPILTERLALLIDGADSDEDVVAAIHAALGRAPSVIKLATLEDLALAHARPNMPGTTTERPNWCLPLQHPLEAVLASELAERVAGSLVLRSGSMNLEGEYEPSALEWVRDQVTLYESSGGTQGNTLRDTGLPVIIVTMRGAKTGKIRKIALMRVEHEGDYAIVASMGGAPTNPGWYTNLLADPENVWIQDGPTPFHVSLREISGEEKAIWWERCVAAFPPYAEYQAKTDRVIPVLIASQR